MTIKEFAQEKNVLDSTVRAWCDKNLIRGAKLDEFEGYIDDLVEAGIIAKYIAKDTGIEYYRQTLKSSEFSKLPINKIKAFLIEAKKIVSVNRCCNL